MESFIEIFDTTWQEFIETNPLSNLNDKKYIYRGQTNGIVNGKFKEWEIVSSFNRDTKERYSFFTFMSQHIQFMDSTYAGYEFVENGDISNSNIISRIYFLQHYGIPTCFVDFTFHPLIALYFSISSLKGQSGGTYTLDGFPSLPSFYPEEYYFTVIRIDVEKLRQILNIKNLQHFDLDLIINYDSYFIEIDENYGAQTALDLVPLESTNNPKNFNMQHQHSCFLLFDNSLCNQFSFEIFLKSFVEKHQVIIDEPFITKYRIKYNTAFKPMHSRQPDYVSLFSYLKKNNISGKTLFNDLQGLKYDFNFFHQD